MASSTSQTLADRYLMTKRLGDGTFGEVLLAKKLDTGDKVAVKRSVKDSGSFLFRRILCVLLYFYLSVQKANLLDRNFQYTLYLLLRLSEIIT
ncbi:unnamed protein product [Gongylonema pulchrum]|uniref:Protein kinase domain-containing protein n=1 Tax=Gongylonema pulchrum TaxID=637853 RepID=A0A183ERN3_9BILA|nr:unnamed protein product [Gongylonema pulchrum]